MRVSLSTVCSLQLQYLTKITMRTPLDFGIRTHHLDLHSESDVRNYQKDTLVNSFGSFFTDLHFIKHKFKQRKKYNHKTITIMKLTIAFIMLSVDFAGAFVPTTLSFRVNTIRNVSKNPIDVDKDFGKYSYFCRN